MDLDDDELRATRILNGVDTKDNKRIIKELDPNEAYFKDGTELVYKLMYNKINEIIRKINKKENCKK